MITLDDLERNILQILLNADKPVSSEKLASSCNASRITIRNRIESLNNQIKDYGLEIQAVRSIGYSIHVFNQETADRFIPHLLFTINRNQYSQSDVHYRSDYIIRKLLMTQDCIPIETICNELYLSYSALHRELNDIQEELSFYHLSIGNRRNHGRYIEGSEWNKRICLLFEHKRYMKLSENEQNKERSFGDLFCTHTTDHRYYRGIVLDILKDYPAYVYSYLNLPKISNYLFLIRARRAEANNLQFQQVQLDTIRTLPSYEIAKRVLKKVESFLGFEAEEIDICGYAMILEGFRTVKDFSSIPDAYQVSMMDECEVILQKMNSVYALNLSKVPNSIYDAFRCDLYSIHMHQLFDIPSDLENLFPQSLSHSMTHDMVAEFRRCYEALFGVNLRADLAVLTFYTFRLLLQSQDDDAGTLRIVILSLYGVSYGRVIASGIRRLYGESRIKSIEVMEYTSPDIDLDYDILLTDIDEVYNYPDNHAHLWLNPTSGRISIHSIDRFLLDQQNAAIQNLISDQIQIVDCKNKTELLQAMAKRIMESYSIDEEELIQDINLQDEAISFERQNYTVVMTLAHLRIPSMIRVLVNRTSIPWNQQECQVFIFCSYDRSSQKERKLNGLVLSRATAKPLSEWLTLLNEPRSLLDFISQIDTNNSSK